MQSVSPSIEFWSSIICFTIIAYTIICFFLGKAGLMKGFVISDRYDIGYVDFPEQSQTVYFHTELKPKPKKQKPPKPEPKPQPCPVVQDCILALNTLGFKKSEAKNEVEKYFNNHPNVESFLKDYFNKRKQ